MNWVDLLVIVLALLAAASGWRQGVAVSLLAFAGVLLGAVVGLRLAPTFVEMVDGAAARIAVGVGVVVMLIAVGETLGVLVGRTIRGTMRVAAVRVVDSALGAAVQAAAVLIAAWLLAVPLASAGDADLASAVRDSRVLGEVNDVLPDSAQRLPSEFGDLLDTSGLPTVLSPFARTPITEVEAPDTEVQASQVVQRTRASVLKVRAAAPSCSRGLEGTGFVVAPQRVMTNAHVIAGANKVAVETAGGQLSATVVLYDPQSDLAVLAVPGLTAPVLSLAQEPATTGESAIVLGYPLDGPYTATPARVRSEISLRGPNIYDDSTVVRDVYTVRGQIRSGNSGGPMIDTNGFVLGVVFGAALDNADTGYVLTGPEVRDEVAAAAGLDRPVATGTCTAS
ncbi:MarP family serine protease [Rhodococcus sp. X156]|uniref:MarP family serine protease n=1 Tax=Rhodococcus sp. X156 TaxID=2499145 RepID=UPI000FD81331|nr:MarP family serine protease [Rhodococcus sp. X156]